MVAEHEVYVYGSEHTGFLVKKKLWLSQMGLGSCGPSELNTILFQQPEHAGEPCELGLLPSE